jgi:hypothetical protein
MFFCNNLIVIVICAVSRAFSKDNVRHFSLKFLAFRNFGVSLRDFFVDHDAEQQDTWASTLGLWCAIYEILTTAPKLDARSLLKSSTPGGDGSNL